MSAPAINPAPSSAPGANASSGASSNSAASAQGPQGHSAIAGFELMLETLFGAKAPTAGAAAPAGGKPVATGKAAVAGDKAAGDKADGDDQTAAADAANPNLALLVPAAAPPNIVTTAETASVDGAAQPALANVASATDKTPAAAGAATLAELAGAAVAADADADKGQAKTALPAEPATAIATADSAATNASAKALAATPKADPAPVSAPVPSAPSVQAAPAATPTPAPAPAPTVESPAPATTAAVAPPPAAEKPAEAAAPQPVAKERVQAIKTSTRVDGLKASGTPGGIAALTAKAADALQAVTGGAPKESFDDEPAEQPLIETKGEAAQPTTPATGDPATAATTTPAHLIHAAIAAVRGAPQTVANLAAQIVKKLDGRSSQFDVQLDPAGLGKVDVRIAIGADGRMSAAMSFDTPQAAAELKSRANELQQAMSQAGFDLSGGMSFDVASDRGQGQGNQAQNQQSDAGAAFRGRAFQAALDNSADTPPPQYALRRAALAGVDIRI